MTILLGWMEENRQPQQQPGSFDCVIRKCANDFAQDDKVGGWSSRWMRIGNGKKQQQISPLAAHDETVSRFGRNDDSFGGGWRRTGNRNSNRGSFDCVIRKM